MGLEKKKKKKKLTRKKKKKKKKKKLTAAAKLEVALQEAEAKRDEALAYLDRVKSSGAGAGQVWWLQREMYEKQKYLPKSKQTMAYPKP